MIWIIDASVAVRWFIKEEAHPHADEVLEKVIEAPERFAVPELFAFEVFSVLQRIHPSGLTTFRKGIIPILQGGIFRQPMTESLAVKANRFVRLGLTGYDACYAALARDLKGIWLTFDEQAHSLIRVFNTPSACGGVIDSKREDILSFGRGNAPELARLGRNLYIKEMSLGVHGFL